MEKIIEDILRDLYEIDPALKEKEAAIATAAQQLLASRPDTGFDDDFRRELRNRLLTEFADAHVTTKRWSFKMDFRRPQWLFAAGAVALVAIVAVVALPGARRAGQSTTSGQFGLTAPVGTIKHGITKVGAKAFGNLALANGGGAVTANDAAMPERALGMPSATSSAIGLSAAPVAPPTAADRPTSFTVSGSGVSGFGGGGPATVGKVASMPIRQPDVTYKFTFAGTLPDLSASQVEVLKRRVAFDTGLLVAAAGRSDISLMDFNKLRDAAVQNITITENRDFGYVISVNFDDGSVNINQNWNRWPQWNANCQPNQPCEPPRVKQSDLLDNAELTRLADAFLTDMGISRADYGDPLVNEDWRQWYAQAEDKAGYWFPEQQQVDYPLIVNGKKVYNSDGRPIVLSVSVDVRQRRVASVSPIYPQDYDASSYDAATDPAKILAIAAQGGLTPIYYAYGTGAESGPTPTVLELDAPEVAYYNHWLYANGRSENILVPALVFPIKNRPTNGALWVERVVVPLAKDLLDQAGQTPIPVPYMMKGSIATPPVSPDSAPPVVPNAAEATGSAPPATAGGTALTEEKARAIAEKTCIKGGESLQPGYYNENSRTWWFDANLNGTKPGCNPACVVSEDQTAEINWRCTGLLVP